MIDETKKFWTLVSDAKRIAIIFNYNWFGDALASALALGIAIGERGTAVEILAQPSERGRILSFLPGFADIKSEIIVKPEYAIKIALPDAELGKVKLIQAEHEAQFIINLTKGELDQSQIKLEQIGWPYDLIITVGCPDKDALGYFTDRYAAHLYKTSLINIDNNFSNESYGQLNIVDIKAAAIAEIIHRLISQLTPELSSPAATCLLAGLISQTKNFKTPTVTPETLELAGRLIRAGADRDTIVNRLYRNRSMLLLKLWGMLLAELTPIADKRLLYSTISLENWQASGAGVDDLVALFEELLAGIPEAVLAVIFIGDSRETRGYVYSFKNTDSLYLAKSFDATGSRKLANFLLAKPLAEASEEAIPILEERLKKIIDN